MFCIYPDALRIAFLNDDYVFLDRVRRVHFLDLWSNTATLFNWYRPWSREVHYWIWQHILGPSPFGFHAVSLVLLILLATAFVTLACWTVGRTGGRFAAAGLLLTSAWSVPILWIAGVQELWMLFLGFLFLLAALWEKPSWLSAFLFALALASKETAVVLPLIAGAGLFLLQKRSMKRIVQRLWPCVVVVIAWALIHPRLLGSIGRGSPRSGLMGPGLPNAIAWSIGSVVNLDRWPRLAGFGAFVVPAAILIVGLILLMRYAPGTRSAEADPAPSSVSRVRTWAALWMVAGWAPALAAGSEWHGYYGLLGSAGAWILLATLVRGPIARMAVVCGIACLCLLQNSAPSKDWGTARYLRRSSLFLRHAERDLRKRLPNPGPGSRLFFLQIPYYVGFVTAGAPALRTWYRDTTLSGGFWSDYVPRDPMRPGRDYFFRFDSGGVFVEVVKGNEDLSRGPYENPNWGRDHQALAAELGKSGDWAGAAFEYGKLVAIFPDHPEVLFNAGVAALGAGDTTRARELVMRAARAPGSPNSIKAAAEMFERTP